MTTPLSRVIDALSTPEIRPAVALRTLLVVSKRLGDENLTRWVRFELDGYPAESPLPAYRTPEGLPITLTFHGPVGAKATANVTDLELPEELQFGPPTIRQPLAELEALAAGKSDPGSDLPAAWVGLYRAAASDRKVPGYELMTLNYARRLFPRTVLLGVIDRVTTSALDLALELERVAPEVGTLGGPTTASEPQILREVNVFLTQVYGSGATVTVGDDATVATGEGTVAIRLEAGDVAGLFGAAGTYLAPDSITDLREALDEDGDKPGPKTTAFLAKVRAGGVGLAAGMITNGAYDGLVMLLGQVFPGFGG